MIKPWMFVHSQVRFPFDENLVGYWYFNEGKGDIAYDRSGYGNDGTLVNSPTWVDGVVGKCLDFDGSNESVTIPYGNGLNPFTTPMSVSMWVKAGAPTESSIFFSSVSGTNQRLYIGHNATTWKIGIQAAGWGLNSGVAATTDWTFITLVMDGSYANVYIDGVYKAQMAYTSYELASNFGINTYAAYLLDGKLDEVRIYSTALTASEIKALYLYPAGNKGLISADTANVNGIPAPNIRGWAYDGDTTYLAGGRIQSGTINLVGGVHKTAASGRRVQIDSGGIKFITGAVSGKYGSNFKYGDGTKYGDGALAHFYNTTTGMPFYVNAEQTIADMHLYNRSSDPSGVAEVGDICVVGGKHKICTVAGTPGTWAVVGDQAA